MRTQSAKSTAIVFLIALLAIGLRFYKLDAQSFWYDEGNSARIAERSVQLIIEGAAGDIHPPLYYLALKLWRDVFGASEFALRALSAVSGVLMCVCVFALGRRMFGTRVGAIAALLIAFSPFAIYYSQEARMYQLLALIACASSLTLICLIQTRTTTVRQLLPTLIAHALLTCIGLYTQYAFAFVMLAQGVSVLMTLAARQMTRTALVAYVIANALALIAFAAWLPIMLRQVAAWSVLPQSYVLRDALLDVLRWIIVGRTLPLSAAWLAIIPVILLAVIALLSRNPKSKIQNLYLLAWLLVPIMLIFALNLYRDAYLKFLLVCVAPFMLLVANGAETVAAQFTQTSRQARALAVAGITLTLVALLSPSLNNLYDNTAYARDDYRGIARLIESQYRVGDAVLFDAPNQWEVFTYYHKPSPDVAAAEPLTYRPASAGDVDAQMREIAAKYKRLFVLYYAERESDPSGWYERWLAERAYKADERWIGNIRLATYSTQTTASAIPQNAPIVFGDAIELVGAKLSTQNFVAGDMLTLQLNWRATRKLDQNYKVFVHVGKPDAPLLAQNDSEPVAGFRPTTSWAVGEIINDQRAVQIPISASGNYQVFVGVYRADNGGRLPLRAANAASDNRFLLTEIAIQQK